MVGACGSGEVAGTAGVTDGRQTGDLAGPARLQGGPSLGREQARPLRTNQTRASASEGKETTVLKTAPPTPTPVTAA